MLKEVDENTYQFRNLLIKKDVLEALHKAIEHSMTEEKIKKLHSIIMRD